MYSLCTIMEWKMAALIASMLLRRRQGQTQQLDESCYRHRHYRVESSGGVEAFKCRLHQFTVWTSLADFRLSGTDIRGKGVYPLIQAAARDKLFSLIFFRS
ncbi:hypothetical protein K443DRAFT_572846 [Laccaria amethystina LaAM-08-1]|uniref:Uncharacterized protein n=1 Tax=Laccaria amethystina LaAM-08-1 TaxID=1095629 RepID=A0A0C9XZY4_9AGAR|nr:hypothetical protein K443DRAFT_572846 [Laccaria amethystina LaAM-08-1]